MNRQIPRKRHYGALRYLTIETRRVKEKGYDEHCARDGCRAVLRELWDRVQAVLDLLPNVRGAAVGGAGQ